MTPKEKRETLLTKLNSVALVPLKMSKIDEFKNSEVDQFLNRFEDLDTPLKGKRPQAKFGGNFHDARLYGKEMTEYTGLRVGEEDPETGRFVPTRISANLYDLCAKYLKKNIQLYNSKQ